MSSNKLIENIKKILQEQPNRKWHVRDLAQQLHLSGDQRKKLKKLVKDLSLRGDITKVGRQSYKFKSDKAKKGQQLQNNQCRGILQMHYDGYGFVLQPNGEDVFIAAPNMGLALPDDEVVCDVSINKRNQKKEGFIVEVIKRGRQEWLGTILNISGEYYAINREFRCEYSIHITNFKESGASVGDVVLVRIEQFPENVSDWLQGQVIHILGPEGDEATEARIVMAKHHIPERFPEEVISQARSLKTFEYDHSTNRVDLRNKPFITIDGSDARDFDDAVLVEFKDDHYHLYVSIADVSHYVRPGSSIDVEALQRGTSTYFPRFCIPMLPEELSNELCSLKEESDRPTLTCELIYDQNGQLRKAHYYRSVIKSVKRAIYEDIQDILEGKKVKGYELIPDLSPAYELFKLLLKNRQRRGALDFDLPEYKFQFDQKGKMTGVLPRQRLQAHMLIEEFMVAANQAVAYLFSTYGIPSLYRIHEQPDPLKMQELAKIIHNLGISVKLSLNPSPLELNNLLNQIKKHPSSSVVNQILLRSLRVAIYAPDNKGHFGLALQYYCHFTSPIRRYPDLIVHRCLAYLLEENNKGILRLSMSNLKAEKNSDKSQKGPYSYKQLQIVGDQNSSSERKSMEAEREMQSLLTCLFMKQFEGEEFLGVVRRIAKYGAFVELTPHYVEGMISINDMGLQALRFDDTHLKFIGRSKGNMISIRIGDSLTVRIVAVDIVRRQIQLERIEQTGLSKRKPGKSKNKK